MYINLLRGFNVTYYESIQDVRFCELINKNSIRILTGINCVKTKIGQFFKL